MASCQTGRSNMDLWGTWWLVPLGFRHKVTKARICSGPGHSSFCFVSNCSPGVSFKFPRYIQNAKESDTGMGCRARAPKSILSSIMLVVSHMIGRKEGWLKYDFENSKGMHELRLEKSIVILQFPMGREKPKWRHHELSEHKNEPLVGKKSDPLQQKGPEKIYSEEHFITQCHWSSSASHWYCESEIKW